LNSGSKVELKKELNQCDFCNKLKEVKEIKDYYKNSRKSCANSKTLYKVSLVELTYESDYPTGTLVHEYMNLNFCPVCGRKINKEGEEKWKI